MIVVVSLMSLYGSFPSDVFHRNRPRPIIAHSRNVSHTTGAPTRTRTRTQGRCREDAVKMQGRYHHTGNGVLVYVRHIQINSDHDGKGLYTYYGVISPILHHNPLRESTYPPWSPAPASAPRVPRSSHRARGICRTFVHTRSPYPSAASRPAAPKEEMVERKEIRQRGKKR